MVVLAIVAGVVIITLTGSSSASFEDAGSTDMDTACRPNEVRVPALEAKGISGTHEHLDKYQAENIGCKPHCGTWEYYSKGQNENGEYEYDPNAALGATIGGSEGASGVFSSNIGCFAPCYWDYTTSYYGLENAGTGGKIDNPSAAVRGARLHYFDDNRPPEAKQVRLGVNYKRITTPRFPDPRLLGTTGTIEPGVLQNISNSWVYSDLLPAKALYNADGKPFIHIGGFLIPGHGPHKTAIATPLSDGQIAAGVPTVFIPNWRTPVILNYHGINPRWRVPDLGVDKRNDPTEAGSPSWVDENWEFRADPINKVCTIVNVTQDDRIVCSSDKPKCPDPF